MGRVRSIIPPPRPREVAGATRAPTARSAVISACGRYRYQLRRVLAGGGRAATFIMLNPSTADGRADDPTIRRCLGFCRRWGCGELHVVNLFGLRATDPTDLRRADDPVGPENGAWVARSIAHAAASGGLVVVAWGADRFGQAPGAALLAWIAGTCEPVALGLTRGGHPRHPLYAPYSAEPIPFPAPCREPGYDAGRRDHPRGEERRMAGRTSLDDKLAALRAFRGQDLTPAQRAEVRQRIGDRSNLVVAAAATIAGDAPLADLAGDLEAAFDRFLVDPIRDDKLCRARLAIVQALDRMEHRRADTFLKAARLVQLEPAWGQPEDTAAPVRAAALVALARVEGPGCLPLLVDALVDPARDVRSAAAVALGAVGSEAAALVLRLKARVGDADPDVLAECLLGLLTASPANLPTVAEFLDAAGPLAAEAAALALGRSRLAEALDPLRERWERPHPAGLGPHLLLAIALLRRPAAIDYLIGLVATGSAPGAIAALGALRVFRDDPRLRERAEQAALAQASPRVRAAFDRDWGSPEP